MNSKFIRGMVVKMYINGVVNNWVLVFLEKVGVLMVINIVFVKVV